jgi:hypothetical protein
LLGACLCACACLDTLASIRHSCTGQARRRSCSTSKTPGRRTAEQHAPGASDPTAHRPPDRFVRRASDSAGVARTLTTSGSHIMNANRDFVCRALATPSPELPRGSSGELRRSLLNKIARCGRYFLDASVCVCRHLYWLSTHTSPGGREESKGAPLDAIQLWIAWEPKVVT